MNNRMKSLALALIAILLPVAAHASQWGLPSTIRPQQ